MPLLRFPDSDEAFVQVQHIETWGVGKQWVQHLLRRQLLDLREVGLDPLMASTKNGTGTLEANINELFHGFNPDISCYVLGRSSMGVLDDSSLVRLGRPRYVNLSRNLKGGALMSQENPDAKVKDLWSKLSQTIKSGAETIVQETKELTRMGKLRVDLMALENERGRKHEDIGRKAHELHKEGIVFPEELSKLFESVNDTELRIQAKKAEIEKARKESEQAKEKPAEVEIVCEVLEKEGRFCTNCGAEAEQADVYCSQCGTKLI